MSSEQWYDYSYEQSFQEELPMPDLSDEFPLTPTTNMPSYDHQDSYLFSPHQGEYSSLNDASVPEHFEQWPMEDDSLGNFESNTSPIPQCSALTTPPFPGFAATSAEQFVRPGDLHIQEEAFQAYDSSSAHPQTGGSEAAKASLVGVHDVSSTDLATPNGDGARSTDLDADKTGPVNVSFFFRTTLMGRLGVAWASTLSMAPLSLEEENFPFLFFAEDSHPKYP